MKSFPKVLFDQIKLLKGKTEQHISRTEKTQNQKPLMQSVRINRKNIRKKTFH